MSDDLNALFGANPVPAPRADLAERIAAAAPARASNDNRWLGRFRWPAHAAIAATLAAGVFVLSSPADESDDWSQYAEAAGFEELYAWVEGEDRE